jgi:general secretion pathway protein G
LCHCKKWDVVVRGLSRNNIQQNPPITGSKPWFKRQGHMEYKLRQRSGAAGRQKGLTLVELIVTVAILAILASASVPLLRFQAKREKERELRGDLRKMREAIDAYRDAADKHAFQTKIDSQNYPPDLEELVKGVDAQGKKLKFLRSIPVDPMTGKAEWNLRSTQDEPTSDSWGGQNVFDVTSKSQGTALDGTKYADW